MADLLKDAVAKGLSLEVFVQAAKTGDSSQRANPPRTYLMDLPGVDQATAERLHPYRESDGRIILKSVIENHDGNSADSGV